MARVAYRLVQISLFFLSVSLPSAATFADQPPDFTGALAPISTAITNDIRHAHGKKVAVIDFAETKGKPTALGRALADALSVSLSKQSEGFQVLDRSLLTALFTRFMISPTEFQNKQYMNVYGWELRADIVVEGEMDDSEGGIILRVEGWRCAVQGWPRKQLRQTIAFSEQAKLAVTAEMQSLLTKPATSYAFSIPDEYFKQTGMPKAGENGYSYPQCIECPEPQYTPAAVSAKAIGVVVLLVVIAATGDVQSVTVIRNLPYGLGERAVNTVKQWKFKPATGPDGRPATVAVDVRVTFRLY